MNRIFVLGLCLLCFAVYFNSLNNSFVFDDESLIVNNHIIKRLEFFPLIFKKGLYELSLSGELPFDKMYRPLQLLTYSIDYKIGRLNPFGYHLTNTLLHLFNSLLIYYLLLIISNNNKLSKVVGILFLVHPIHTSVVSYIAGRADLLACLFMLLSIIGFLQFIKLKSRTYYIVSLLFALLALFSRENALLLFLFIILILFITKAKSKYYLYVIPFILLDFLYILLRFLIFGRIGLTMHPSFLSLPLRIVNFFNIIPRYLLILLLPKELHLFRTTPFIRHLIDIRTLFSIIFVLFWVFVIVRFRKNKLLLFAIVWFMIGLIPVFTFLDRYISLNEAVMAESWLYFSSVGFFIVFVSLLNIFKKLGRTLLIIFIIFYGFLTVVNNLYWKNNIILYTQMLEYTPEKNPLRKALIAEYLKHGLFRDALGEMKKLEIYYPDSPDLYSFWGDYYFLTGQLNAAIDNYNIALTKGEKFYIYHNLSICYGIMKQFDKAIEYGLKCFKIKPYYVPNLIQMGDTHIQKRQFTEANEYYQMALDLEPDNQLVKQKKENAE